MEFILRWKERTQLRGSSAGNHYKNLSIRLTNVDWDWISFLVGAATGIAVAIFGGFIGEVGKDLYSSTKRTIQSPEPDPIAVGWNYQIKNYSPESCVWAKENFVTDKLADGYSYYRDPADDARRYRISNPSDPQPVKEFLMLKPNAEKSNDTVLT